MATSAAERGSKINNMDEDDDDVFETAKIRVRRNWDLPRQETDDEKDPEGYCYHFSLKLLKLFFILVSFSIILSSIVVSKLSILFITSNVVNTQGVTTYSSFTNRSCVNDEYLDYPARCGMPVCNGTKQGEIASYPGVRWMWSLLLCISTPYVITIFRSLRQMLFKQKKNPKLIPSIIVIVIETLHSFGLMIICYQCLPALDSTRGIFLMTAVGFIPSLLRPFISSNIPILISDIAVCVVQVSAVIFYPLLTLLKPVRPESGNSISCLSSISWPDIIFDNENRSNRTRIPEIDFWPFSLGLILVSLVYWENFIHERKKDKNSNSQNADSMVRRDINESVAERGESIVAQGAPAGSTNQTFSIGSETSVASSKSPNASSNIELHRIGVAANDNDSRQPEGSINSSVSSKTPITITQEESHPCVDVEKGIFCCRSFHDTLWKLKTDIQETRTKTNLIVYSWKLVLSFCLLLLMFSWKYSWEVSVFELFDGDNFEASICRTDSLFHRYDWLLVYAIQAISTLIGYYTATFTVMGSVQVATYTLAVTLATPVSIGILLHACLSCESAWPLDTAAYFNCSNGWVDLISLANDRWTYIGIFWLLSQLWITRYLWFPTNVRMAPTDKIMIKAGYCGALFEQSLAYNRKRDDGECEEIEHKSLDISEEHHTIAGNGNKEINKMKGDPNIPMIYLCATMWHEEKKEMTQLLKSMLRLDHAKRNTALWKETPESGYDQDRYNFEAHIFFDNAFDKDKSTVNKYVRWLVETIGTTADSYTKEKNKIGAPTIAITPYGGRLVYTLPQENKLIVHLKDLKKIRNKKRWSQVMYMYYLLMHKLWCEDESEWAREVRADNTFLLALDGDVDFRPNAVERLIDLMKRNKKVGAACGRIHPIGSGPMVWYQKFEYSIGHWLQKATEHVLGCVLCSPGCFSLFRGSALLETNVLRTYSNEPKDARQHMQYDQGEDRWLCTLLLKQGLKVEYSAAADAFTYAPEGFEEFFKQRRRWTPSTMSNILELLESGGKTVKANENISWLYMIYQGILFFTSLLGPGTIFMLSIGALEATFFTSTPWAAYLLISVPVVMFIITALVTEAKFQLKFAFILCIASIILQIVVLVGVFLMIEEDGLCNPASWILVWVIGVFVLAAILHPNEGLNIVCLPVFFLSIPSMYLILIIYAVCNLNDVGWGTRESTKTETNSEATDNEQIKDKLTESKYKNKLCRTCCPCFVLDGIQQQITRIHTTLHDHIFKENTKVDDMSGGSKENAVLRTKKKTKNVKINPQFIFDTWLSDDIFKNATPDQIDEEEVKFWDEFITKFGKPICNKEEKENRKQLKQLRNKASLAFIMINAVFIVLISTLEVVEIQVSYNCTRPATQEEIRVDVGAIEIAFTAIFGFIMVIQVGGMLIHRFFTLLQVISSTSMLKEKDRSEKSEATDMMDKIDDLILPKEARQVEIETPMPSGQGQRANPRLSRVLSMSETMMENRKSTLKRDRAAKYLAVLNAYEKSSPSVRERIKPEFKTLLSVSLDKDEIMSKLGITEEDAKIYDESAADFVEKEVYPAPDYD